VLRREPGAVDEFTTRMLCVPCFLRAFNRTTGAAMSEADLDDLQQEVYLAVWKALPRYRGESALETWVFPFCSRHFFQRLRRRDGERELEAGLRKLLDALERRPTPSMDDPECELGRLLRCLSEREREVVILNVVYEFTIDEVAAALGIARTTVITLRRRAIEKLREQLPPDGELPHEGHDE